MIKIWVSLRLKQLRIKLKTRQYVVGIREAIEGRGSVWFVLNRCYYQFYCCLDYHIEEIKLLSRKELYQHTTKNTNYNTYNHYLDLILS